MATDPVLEAIAEDAAERASRRTSRDVFKLFGVDIEDQEQVNSFRADLIHAHNMRKLSERAGARVWMMVVSAGTGGALVAMWDGIKAKLGL